MTEAASLLPSFKTDCRHFRPDRPCAPHKSRGVVCRDCPVYDPVSRRVLLLKTGAVGDVLRTTALLPALKEKHPNAFVTWVAHPAAFPLFDGSPHLDRLLPFSWETLGILRRERFDLLLSLDFDPAVAAWVPEIRADEKRGFVYSDGLLTALNEEARGWVDMSLNDRLKRANRRTYPDWMFSLCGFSRAERYEPQWTVSPEEKSLASRFFSKLRSAGRKKIVGLNTGAGRRWQQKKWPEKNWIEFIRLLQKEKDILPVLLGGPEERGRNRLLKKKFPRLLDTGCDNSLRGFGALVNHCDAVVTGDTLAMHIAIALKKRVIALFGPTSSAEIELYGRGEKLHRDWDCLPCYLPRCTRSPHCMEALSPKTIADAVRRQIGLLPSR
ncbi:MAG TPA: glycosyltransferase family 9 protein [Elusimicrobiota bacterium]|nr:glycosyltransferase family 9 protein [Elusimicrobiota bacterium]